MDMEGLWGVFSFSGGNGDSFSQRDTTLGWPFGAEYNTMGTSIWRESNSIELLDLIFNL